MLQASRRHRRRSASDANTFQLPNLDPNLAHIRVLQSAASRSHSRLLFVVFHSSVKMPPRVAPDLEAMLFTRSTARVSGGLIAVVPVTLVVFGKPSVPDDCQLVSRYWACQQIDLRVCQLYVLDTQRHQVCDELSVAFDMAVILSVLLHLVSGVVSVALYPATWRYNSY